MSRSGSARLRNLLLLALVALLLQSVLEITRRPVRQRDYDLKLLASEKAEKAMETIRRQRRMEGAELDLVNDPAGSGLIGPEYSLITNSRGVLDSKLTSVNPNFAGVFVEMFQRIGVEKGDKVAVAVSGSFPGLNIGLFSAIDALELDPTIITSVGASMWGANDPRFTWLDMETELVNKGLFKTRTDVATFGGGDDMGRGLSPKGRELIEQAIERNNVQILASTDIEDAIEKRMTFYESNARGRRYKAFINIGGGVASIGSSRNKILLNPGLSFELEPRNWPRKGTMVLMSDKGIPIIHMLGIVELAQEFGLPVAPDYLPMPGEGEIFERDSYRLDLSALFFISYFLLCAFVLAPEVRRNFAGMWRRRQHETN
jgi:poly-gamma-glutamate system protein